MDLSVFQFDYDQTWAAFFLNADGTVYGRYGSRSDKNAVQDVSIEGFVKAAEAAALLHQQYPANKRALAGKTAPAPRFATPESYPSLSSFSAIVVPGARRNNNKCIHCHQVHAADLNYLRATKRPILDKDLWSYAMPAQLGLGFDPKEKATLASIAPGSAAEKAGFRVGDKVVRLEEQPIISIADVQWILQHAREPGQVNALVERGAKTEALRLPLASGWRSHAEFAWRDSTCGWAIARFNSADASSSVRKQLGLAEDALALVVDFVGIEIREAGLTKKDVIVAVDGQRARKTESQFLAYVVRSKLPGDALRLAVLRAGKEMIVNVPVQEIR